MVVAGVMIGASLSCTDLPTDPKTPFAISFRRAPSPSVVLGDVLRDSTGAPAPLKAVAFNLRGDTIQDATVTYFLVAKDSQPVALGGDQITALADTAYIGDTARVVAVAGGVQSTPLRIVVTVRPDSIRRIGADTVRFLLPAVDTLPQSAAMQVKLLHMVTASERTRDTIVPVYEVRYRVDSTSSHLTDTSYVTINDESRHYAPVDTTDANGIAARQLRVRRAKYPYPYEQIPPGGSAVDTVYVSATARYRGTAVTGSPIRFRVLVTLSKPPTS
jgi:hypothetical protein